MMKKLFVLMMVTVIAFSLMGTSFAGWGPTFHEARALAFTEGILRDGSYFLAVNEEGWEKGWISYTPGNEDKPIEERVIIYVGNDSDYKAVECVGYRDDHLYAVGRMKVKP